MRFGQGFREVAETALRIVGAVKAQQGANFGGEQVLIEGIVSQQLFRQRERSVGHQTGKLLERGVAAPVDPTRALEVEPLGPAVAAAVVQALEQRASTPVQGVAGTPLGQGAVGRLDIGGDAPAQLVVLRLESLRPRQGMRVMQHLAQVAAGRGLVMLGPEQRRERIAADPDAPQREIGQKLEAPLGAQRR